MSKSTRPASAAPDRVSILFATGAFVAVMIPHLTRLPLWALLVVILAPLWRIGIAWERLPKLPLLVRLPLVMVAVAGIYTHFGTLLGKQAGVALLAVMMALKLLEAFRRRDIYLVLSLCYFVALTQFLFSQSIVLAIYLGLTALIITVALYLHEVQPTRAQRSGAVRSSPWPALRASAILLAQSLPLMLIMFLFLPRLSSPLWGVPEEALDAKTGISDEMSPGSIVDLLIDDSTAFRVRFEDDLPPPANERYWRGPSLWRFDGRTWDRRAYYIRNEAENGFGPPGPWRYEISQEPTEQQWLFPLDFPTTVPLDARLLQDGTMLANDPLTRIHVYEGRSNTEITPEPRIMRIIERAALQLPEGYNPRARALAQRWRDEINNDRAIVATALRMFQQQEFFYSLSPPPLGYHSVDDFLFSTQRGFCEHYSSAFTFLMRAAGVPARVVTGYQGGWFHPTGKYLLVRQSDAHAWAEVWYEDEGWVRIDPTAAVAPDRIERGAMQSLPSRRSTLDYPWLRELRNQLDIVNSLWNEFVVKFDRSRQESLLESFGVDELDVRSTLLALVIAGSALLGILLFWISRERFGNRTDPIVRSYERLRAKLARAGIERRGHEGPLDLQQRASRKRPDLQAELEGIFSLYIRLRYGTTQSAEAATELRKRVQSLRVANRPAAAP